MDSKAPRALSFQLRVFCFTLFAWGRSTAEYYLPGYTLVADVSLEIQVQYMGYSMLSWGCGRHGVKCRRHYIYLHLYIFFSKPALNIQFLSNISTSAPVPSLLFHAMLTMRVPLLFHRRCVHRSGSSTCTIIQNMHTYSPHHVRTCREVHCVRCSCIIPEHALVKNAGKNSQS